ncbi:hypothetical protein ACP8HZ_02890 [Francisella noatunensis]
MAESRHFIRSDDICYRESDAAMLHIFTPYFSDGLEFVVYQKGLALVEDLIRDYGVIRYKGDSYQSDNFWFEDDGTAKESLTDDASSVEQICKKELKVDLKIMKSAMVF